MDMRNSSKMVLTTPTAPKRRHFPKWPPKAVFCHNFAHNCHIIMNFGSKYMFMGMRNSFKMV